MNARYPFRIVSNATGQTLVFDNGATGAQLNQTAASSGNLIAVPVQIANALTISSATPDRSLTMSGVISGGSLTKSGLGEILITAPNTFEGVLSVQGGRLVCTAQASGSPLGAATNSIIIGGSNPREACYTPTLYITNTTSASTTSFGDLTAGGSFNSGYLAPGASVGGTSYLQGEDLLHDAGATLVISPINATNLAVRERVQFSGTGTSMVNEFLPLWLVVALNNGDFSSYGANGIQRATYTSASFNPLLTDQIVNLTSATNLLGSQTAYALRMGANLNLNGNSLTLGDGTTGGLILFNNTAITNSGAGSLSFGGELLTYVDAANTATISAPLSGSGVFRKFGTGTLVLTQPSLPDTVNLQAGGLTLNPTADFTYTGNINGAGTLYKDGSKSVSLDGLDWTLGGIWIKDGTLRLSEATVTNMNALVLGPTAQSTYLTPFLVITNGSRVVQMAGGAIVGKASAYYTVKNHAVIVAGAHPVSGAKATWDLGNSALHIGLTANPSTVISNSVTVASGGMITNAASIIVGSGSGGSYQKMTIANGGQVHCTGMTVGGSQSFAAADVLNGSLLRVGGATLTIGSRGDILVEGCQLTISDSIVTNVSNFTVGTAGGNAAYATNNQATISNGGKLYSTGSATIGTMTAGGNIVGAYRNSVRVTGIGTLWNAGGGALSIGLSSQGNTQENLLWIGLEGSVTNAGTVWIGYAGAYGATENRLLVTNGATFFSTGSVLIGRANPSTTQPRPATFNGAWVGGENARWDLGGAAMTLGTATLGAGYPTCTATSNWLRVERGGIVTSVGALTLGNGVLAVNNRIELAGGSLSAASLSLNAGNLLAPTLDDQGLTAMTVSGVATFSAGSWIDPDATKDALPGTYTVLTAGSIVGGGNLALAPGTDTGLWSLQVTSTAVKITKRDRGTLLQIR